MSVTIKYTMQEKEVLYAVAHAKVQEIETKISRKRVKPGQLAYTRMWQELSIWRSIEAKFRPDWEELS